jgi:hypothetical protein
MNITPHWEKAMPGFQTPLQKLEAELQKETPKYAVHDPSNGLISETQKERGGQLNTIILDGITKFILREIKEDGWQKVVEKWKGQGGDVMAKEYTAALKAIQ